MLSTQPGTEAVRRADWMAQCDKDRTHQAELTELRELLSHLLQDYDAHDIADELQKLHNEQPEEQRQGYRMKIAMLSKDYQLGAYDNCF